MKKLWITALALASTVAVPQARAFCGFYVGGSGESLSDDATVVVLLRDGTKTVLSMQNNYQGPPESFAMVVPVPEVLDEERVKTLPRDIFQRVDQMAAPRLVEYWEQDPCALPMPRSIAANQGPTRMATGSRAEAAAAADLGVTIEAEFEVAEYDIVILSARDSAGLDTWLRREGYHIPANAEPLLRPYVESDSKFFVAKVDISKVQYANVCPDAPDDDMPPHCRQIVLSPLRFHYDSDQLALPIRLGLMNADGPQDLVVHILARNQRYEVANYPNVTIPTNIDVDKTMKNRFGEFYAALFDETLARNPGAVITEYSWQATSCDPCPGPQLGYQEIFTLGGDVVSHTEVAIGGPGGFRGRRPAFFGGNDYVLTRLHARYDAGSVGEDLVFRAAPPIVGGREVHGDDGELERGALPSSSNNFQGRYAIRHEWTGPIECAEPRRGIWGGPPGGMPSQPAAARNTAFAPRGGLQLAEVVRSSVPSLGLSGLAALNPVPADPHMTEMSTDTPPTMATPTSTASSGCSCRAPGSAGGAPVLALFFIVGVVLTRRR